jgi:hypothetical protein
MVTLKRWVPPGPVAARFMQSLAPVHGIMGPVRSGKTTAALYKVARLANLQNPDGRGVRRTRALCLRYTYRELHRTLLRSWKEIIPPSYGEFDGGGERPVEHRVRYPLPDGTFVELDVWFHAVGEGDVEEFCRGLEVTFAFLEEADLFDGDLIEHLSPRCGQFPRPGEVLSYWSGVMMCFNAPIWGNWLQRRMEEPRVGDEFFIQPGGRTARAENVKNLPPGYYEREAANKGREYVRRMIDNRPGMDRSGRVVYEDWEHSFHVGSERLCTGVDGVVFLGFDGGLSPAMVVGEPLGRGRIAVLGELCMRNTGPERFGGECARFLAAEFSGVRVSCGFAEPSCFFGGGDEDIDPHWARVVSKRLGVRLLPSAPNNTLGPRLSAVTNLLNYAPGGEPGLVVSPVCRMLIAGFDYGYRFRRKMVVGSDVYDMTTPEKNEYSHPHDALQALVMGYQRYGVDSEFPGARKVLLRGFSEPVQARGDFDVWKS